MTAFHRDFLPEELISAADAELAIAANEVIRALALKWTAWRDEPQQRAQAIADEFAALICTVAKQEVIGAYSAGVISDGEAQRIIQENGLKYS